MLWEMSETLHMQLSTIHSQMNTLAEQVDTVEKGPRPNTSTPYSSGLREPLSHLRQQLTHGSRGASLLGG